MDVFSFCDSLDYLKEVLEDCQRNFASNDLEETDYIHFQLESYNSFLSSYLSNLLLSQPVSDNNSPLLREFHRCINDLQQIWHIKLARLEGRSTTCHEGRPRKLFNVELVRIVINIAVAWSALLHEPDYKSLVIHGQDVT